MAVMATDQPSSTNTSNEASANGSRSPTDGGFTPGWSQEAEQRVEARRSRVQAVGAEHPRVPPQPHPVAEEVDDDDEERKLKMIFYLPGFIQNHFS